MKTPQLTVVGAGPGDPDLITLRALQTIEKADAILYDALISPQLLERIPTHIPKLFVGKRKDEHAYTQDQINRLIVSYAYHFGHVVRLKGGDPFTFGRGSEEIAYARLFRVETAYVPGISSSISVPGLCGIPVTHRGVSESFWVITGTTRYGELSHDMYTAAKTNATIVVLMGLNQLEKIVNVFLAENNDAPIAIIQNGSLPNEKIAVGTISTIEKIAREEKIGSPATMVIGKVVDLYRTQVQSTTSLVQNRATAFQA